MICVEIAGSYSKIYTQKRQRQLASGSRTNSFNGSSDLPDFSRGNSLICMFVSHTVHYTTIPCCSRWFVIMSVFSLNHAQFGQLLSVQHEDSKMYACISSGMWNILGRHSGCLCHSVCLREGGYFEDLLWGLQEWCYELTTCAGTVVVSDKTEHPIKLTFMFKDSDCGLFAVPTLLFHCPDSSRQWVALAAQQKTPLIVTGSNAFNLPSH